MKGKIQLDAIMYHVHTLNRTKNHRAGHLITAGARTNTQINHTFIKMYAAHSTNERTQL